MTVVTNRVSWTSSLVMLYPFLVVLVCVCTAFLGGVVVSTAAMRAAETASESATHVLQSACIVPCPPWASAQCVLCAYKISSSVFCARLARGDTMLLLSFGISFVKAPAKNRMYFSGKPHGWSPLWPLIPRKGFSQKRPHAIISDPSPGSGVWQCEVGSSPM
jgi:hypothetical protein